MESLTVISQMCRRCLDPNKTQGNVPGLLSKRICIHELKITRHIAILIGFILDLCGICWFLYENIEMGSLFVKDSGL